MEKYPLFSGLNSLSSQNLATTRAVLPRQGIAGKLIKSDEIVMFDLDSKDIWLDIQVECFDIKLVIFFEAKVAKNLTMKAFMNLLMDIISTIFKANKIELTYEIEDLSIKKMHLSDGNFVAKNLKSSVLGQDNLPEYVKEIECDSLICEIFDYLDRCVLAELQKNTQPAGLKKIIFSKAEIEAKLLNMSSELPIRGLRVEEKKFVTREFNTKNRNGQDLNSKVCTCHII